MATPKKIHGFDSIFGNTPTNLNTQRSIPSNGFDSIFNHNNANLQQNYVSKKANNNHSSNSSSNGSSISNDIDIIKDDSTRKQSIQQILYNTGFNDNISIKDQQIYNEIASNFVKQIINESMTYTQSRQSRILNEIDIERAIKKYNMISYEEWLEIKMRNKQQMNDNQKSD